MPSEGVARQPDLQKMAQSRLGSALIETFMTDIRTVVIAAILLMKLSDPHKLRIPATPPVCITLPR